MTLFRHEAATTFQPHLIRSAVSQVQAEKPSLPASKRASHQNRLARRLPAHIPGPFFSYSVECRRAEIPRLLWSRRGTWGGEKYGEPVDYGAPVFSAHTHTHTAPRGSLVAAKRWEGRGAPLCAKLMRFHIVFINSRCGAEPPPHPPSPPPPDDWEFTWTGFQLFDWLFLFGFNQSGSARPRGRRPGLPHACTQVPPQFVSFCGFNLKNSTPRWGPRPQTTTLWRRLQAAFRVKGSPAIEYFNII